MGHSNLPKGRLNQIARRKLIQLGVPSALSRDGEVLEGEIISTHGKLYDPFTGRPIPRVRFRVAGHDHLIFLEPPVLVALPPHHFYEFLDLLLLLQTINSTLATRAETLKRVARHLQGSGMDANIDPARGMVVARVDLGPAL